MEIPVKLPTVEDYQSHDTLQKVGNAIQYFAQPDISQAPQNISPQIHQYLSKSSNYASAPVYPTNLSAPYSLHLGEKPKVVVPQEIPQPPIPVEPIAKPVIVAPQEIPKPMPVPVLEKPAAVEVPKSTAQAKTSVKIGGEDVELIDDSLFCLLRHRDGVSEAMLDKSNFTFSALGDGGGKGGSLMQITNDERFFVKELNKDDLKGLKMIQRDYVEHIMSHPGSLLARFYFSFRRGNGKEFLVMGSCMPKAALHEKLDLKGSADDKMLIQDGKKVPQVHKRFYMVHWLAAEACCNAAGVPQDRRNYASGKKAALNYSIRLGSTERQAVCKTVEADVRLLQRVGVMDYSLLVGKLVAPAGAGGVPPTFPQGPVPSAGQPLVVKEGENYAAYYFGIIDFLQPWTGMKQAAHVIKTMFAPKPISTIAPKEYAEQFITANNRRFVS